MIQCYTIIANADEKSRQYSYDYSLNGESVIISPVSMETLGRISSDAIVILHANDILPDTTLQKQILDLVKEKSWTLYLFTNATDGPFRKIEGFADIYTWNDIKRRWNDIKRSFTAVLPPEETYSELLMALYLLCKGYLSGLSRLDSPEKIRDWWKLAGAADFKTEIEGLKEDDNSKHTVVGLIDQLKNALDTEPSALPEIVNNLHVTFSEMEQNGRFL